jgi:hypothetical protein
MTSAEQRFVKEFLVSKTVELRALESKLWKDGLLYSTEEPELNRFWKAEWDAREALQAGLAGIFEQPQAKRLMKEREKIDKELDRAYRGLDKVLSEAADRKEDDRASAASKWQSPGQEKQQQKKALIIDLVAFTASDFIGAECS